MSTEVATLPQHREITQVIDAVPILDTARFEHMQRIASVLARSTMIPETLRTIGPRDKKEDLPYEQILSNCFLVVNQAARWGMDPFSCISCCSVVHGRLAYEGKLVAAVLDAKIGIALHHHFTGDPSTDACRIYLSDQPFTDDTIAKLKPGVSIPGLNLWDGSVGEWKTSGTGTPWTPKNYRRMLIYRGTRDWARIYKPALMLGVYTEDELLDLAEDARSRRATPVLSLADKLSAAKVSDGQSGFSQAHVERETEAQVNATNHPADQVLTSNDPAATQDKTGEIAPANSNSSQPASSPDATETDKPASEQSSLLQDAGDSSEPADNPPPVSDDEGAQPGPAASSTGLPQGWEITYAAALRRAQKIEGLDKHAAQYWSQYGGWEKHKNGPDAETAKAIFDAFQSNFGRKEVIEAALRELF